MWATSHPIPLIPDGLTGNLQTRDRPALPLLPRNTSDEDSSWGFSSALLRFLEIVSAGKKDKGQRKMVHGVLETSWSGSSWIFRGSGASSLDPLLFL